MCPIEALLKSTMQSLWIQECTAALNKLIAMAAEQFELVVYVTDYNMRVCVGVNSGFADVLFVQGQDANSGELQVTGGMGDTSNTLGMREVS